MDFSSLHHAAKAGIGAGSFQHLRLLLFQGKTPVDDDEDLVLDLFQSLRLLFVKDEIDKQLEKSDSLLSALAHVFHNLTFFEARNDAENWD